MSATAAPATAPPPARETGALTKERTSARPRRRWHRAVLPFAAVAALLIVTGVAYGLEQPDQSDPAFLSPVSDAGIGASRLAGRVRAAGVTVQRETRTAEALRLADSGAGDATLLLPTPSLVHREYLRLLPLLPAGTRVVLVEPRSAALRRAEAPIAAGPRRWAAAVTAPSDGAACGLAPALAAGPAAVARQRYGPVRDGPEGGADEVERCYRDGLVVLRWRGVEVVLAGASDPFRNDRIGEHGNAALATGLLTARSRLVWLDLHQEDPPPRPAPGPGDPEPTEPSDDGSGEDRGNAGEPDGPQRPGDGRGDGSGDGSGDEPAERPNAEPPDERNPLLDAFPSWVWALLAQLLLAAVLLTLWRARRLGPPVAEPLPVTVRAAETVLGRGRLYQRARARGPALDILRSATRARLTALLKLPPGVETAELADAVAARTGRDPAQVRELLAGPAPDHDEDLVRMARDLETLPQAVRGEER